ncbi:MAG: penicillin-binding protein, partial [Bernardetiaceae bacterium]|nr:penicillin-binding protein [Bernardetiaceae bacterium]
MFFRVVKILWVIVLSTILGIILWAWAVSANTNNLFGGMPDLRELENPQSSLASEIYSSDGELLGKFYRENRTQTKYKNISSNVVNALLATEDVRFFEHAGIDLRSLSRVVVGLITFNRQGGGSTISQQLAKNLFGTRTERYEGVLTRSTSPSFLRMGIIKTKEWIMAIRLERAYTKEEIMEMYLNTVDFGRNSFGINVAARRYFNVGPDSLALHQAAVLVGMLKAPTRYNPSINPENAIHRRNVVFAQMEKYDFIDGLQRDSLRILPLHVNEASLMADDEHNQGLAPYFRTVLRNELMEWCKKRGYDLFADGLKIYTTI